MSFINKKKILEIVLFFIICSALVFFDQFTKKLAEVNLLNKEPKVLIKNILEFVYTENQGAAFGILQGRQILFYILTIIVFAFLLVMLLRLDFTLHNIWYFIILCLIFSGALGNFIDRAMNKYVVDFIYFVPIDFPVFNLADVYITCGCGLMLITMFTIYRKD